MRLLIVPVVLATMLACVEDVGKDKVKATVEDVPAAAAKKAPEPPAGKSVTSYKVDASKSAIRALGAKITATHPVDFKAFQGKVGLTDDKVSAVSFEVTMKDLESDHPKLTSHLLNADFFDVEKHPTSQFVSREIKQGAAEEGFTHTVTGEMTIMGTTKLITFPAKIEVGAAEVKANTEFVINRQDFGISYPGRPDDLIQDNVRMTISLVAPRS
jgi:polyisoprenoid-binding protein YceI